MDVNSWRLSPAPIVLSVGLNTHGQLGRGSYFHNSREAKIVDQLHRQCLEDGECITELHAGSSMSCGLTNKRNAYVWGKLGSDQPLPIKLASPLWNNCISKVAFGDGIGLVLRTDGRLFQLEFVNVGSDSFRAKTVLFPSQSAIRSLYCFSRAYFVIDSGGTAYSWGDDGHLLGHPGIIGLASPTRVMLGGTAQHRVASIEATADFTLWTTEEGRVYVSCASMTGPKEVVILGEVFVAKCIAGNGLVVCLTDDGSVVVTQFPAFDTAVYLVHQPRPRVIDLCMLHDTAALLLTADGRLSVAEWDPKYGPFIRSRCNLQWRSRSTLARFTLPLPAEPYVTAICSGRGHALVLCQAERPTLLAAHTPTQTHPNATVPVLGSMSNALNISVSESSISATESAQHPLDFSQSMYSRDQQSLDSTKSFASWRRQKERYTPVRSSIFTPVRTPRSASNEQSVRTTLTPFKLTYEL